MTSCCEPEEPSPVPGQAGLAHEQLAGLLKALGHPVRIGIIRQLQAQDCCCGDLCACLPLAQSTVSQHLDLLRRAGLVELQTEGTRSRYRLNRETFRTLAAAIGAVAATGDPESTSLR